jgi:hypothetical protein
MRYALLLPLVCLIVAACSPVPPKAAAKKIETVKLEKGTKVKAILLKELTSGGSEEGEEVPMMVAEHVMDAKGRVLIAKGTPVTGVVTWSRGEGTFGSLLQQPARLNFRFEHTQAIDGSRVRLSAEEEEEADYMLTRANTSRERSTEALAKVAEDEENTLAAAALKDLFETGDIGKLQNKETRDRVAKIAEELGMVSTSNLVKNNDLDKVGSLIQQIRRGGMVANLASGGSASALDAVLELANVAGHVGNRLANIFKGRNVWAHVGTPVHGFVLEEVDVKIEVDDSETR